jgi:hypothetical protein
MEEFKKMVTKNFEDSTYSSSPISEYLRAIFKILTSKEIKNSRNTLVKLS